MVDVPSFFELAPEEQREILASMATQLGPADSILEKDVWLCLVLEKLFQLPDAKPMAFKGGTSLSKIYRAIERFSEDIDVTIDWAALHPKPPTEEDVQKFSKTKIRELAGEIKAGLEAHIKEVVLPGLADAMESVAPKAVVEYEKNTEGELVRDKLRVYYPAVTTAKGDYLPQSILIEFGAKNSIEPIEQHVVVPDIAEHVPGVSYPSASVHVLSPQRTFWEKATLIHDECHRPAEKAKASVDRLSRHWYDLARLARHDIGPAALENMALLGQVILIKKRFFSYGFSQYDECRTGGMRLIPDGAVLEALRVDYGRMVEAAMFYGEILEFDEIVAQLKSLEAQVNERAIRIAPEVGTSAPSTQA